MALFEIKYWIYLNYFKFYTEDHAGCIRIFIKFVSFNKMTTFFIYEDIFVSTQFKSI